MLVTGEHLRREVHSFHLTDKAKFIGEVIDGELVCVMAFDNYNGTNIDVHIVASRITRRMLKAAAEYAFNVCGCRRMTSLNDANEFEMEPYLERLGFKYEGRLRHALPDSDLLVYGLIREDCKWVSQSQAT